MGGTNVGDGVIKEDCEEEGRKAKQNGGVFATVTSADLRPLAYKGLFSKRMAPPDIPAVSLLAAQ